VFLRVILDYFVLVLSVFVVFDFFFGSVPTDCLERTSPKWPILCWVGCETLAPFFNTYQNLTGRVR